ncbi:MAG: hypothetical protein LBL96_04160 [Clostridiales bacterium]|jgi:hypothetical protein|nr:hypothetical protein [Clostridiales bacterium]
MMKILIIGTIDGNYGNREEPLCEKLRVGLKKLGHETELCFLPFRRDALNAAEQILAYRMVDSSGADALVTVGYPACFIPSTKKVSYLFDIYPEIHENFSFKLREHRVEERLKMAEKITSAESRVFREANSVFTADDALNSIMRDRYGVRSTVLKPSATDLAKRVECALL